VKDLSPLTSNITVYLTSLFTLLDKYVETDCLKFIKHVLLKVVSC